MDNKTWWTCYQKLLTAYGKEADKAQSDVFFEALQSVPGPVMRLAIDELIKSEAYFPTVAKLRRYCDGAHRDIAAPSTACPMCHGSTWVEAPAIHENGLTYTNVVKRCPACWVLGETRA